MWWTSCLGPVPIQSRRPSSEVLRVEIGALLDRNRTIWFEPINAAPRSAVRPTLLAALTSAPRSNASLTACKTFLLSSPVRGKMQQTLLRFALRRGQYRRHQVGPTECSRNTTDAGVATAVR